MINITTPLLQNPSSNSNNNTNIGRPFLGHYCFELNLPDPCPSVDKKRRSIACIQNDHAPTQEPLP